MQNTINYFNKLWFVKKQTTGNALCPLGPFCPLNSKILKKLKKEPNDE